MYQKWIQNGRKESPQEVIETIEGILEILDTEYGADRNYDFIDYSIRANTAELKRLYD